MEIFVISMRGLTITLYVSASETIRDIKEMIQYEEGIHPNQQRLFIDWREDLKDDLTLSESNIHDGETLHLMYPRTTFDIIVKTWTGEMTWLQVEASDRISIIKKMIEVSVDIRVGWQRLIFASKELEDGRTLSDYNITEGDVLMVAMA